MSFKQTTYYSRLPYGYSFDPGRGLEYIFDRGYQAIASRRVASPWDVQFYADRATFDTRKAEFTERFYKSPTSPASDETVRSLCEGVAVRFLLGRDVRSCLPQNKPVPGGQTKVPKTGGRYVPMVIDREYQHYMANFTHNEEFKLRCHEADVAELLQ